MKIRFYHDKYGISVWWKLWLLNIWYFKRDWLWMPKARQYGPIELKKVRAFGEIW